MLRFVMYTVIDALVPLTTMVVSIVRESSNIISFYERLFIQLRDKQEENLIVSLNALMDYLLEIFEQATVKTRTLT